MALSCQRNYLLSKPHLKKYKALRPEWRNVTIGESLSLLGVLVVIAKEPFIARLIRTSDASSAARSEDIQFFQAMCNPRDPEYPRLRHRMGFIESGIASLRECGALKEVQLDLLMLAAPPRWSGLRSGLRGLSLGTDAAWKLSEIPPLSQILPTGIERVSSVMHAGHGIDHGQSELEMVRKQLRTLKALFVSDVKLSHPYLQEVILRHDGRRIDLGMHTVVGHSGERMDALLESQVARSLRATGVVGVVMADRLEAFESTPWEEPESTTTLLTEEHWSEDWFAQTR
ncbi:hypothetical protein CERZMDRAFT_93380 [Cercospora zeae-maydis SCOH1-5]|uniref:Uncharacterized protein n=1 Tax=Cercospora zeae-maydis SCOH1-5 TaxID=717836 RepID=A0A6A6FV03_9PEZI|nr:hypothetical protein CERZMDRAFT_93380 [Cercospora zeae-maydis SCOH1-5]